MRKTFKKSMPFAMAGIMILGSMAPIFATVTKEQTITSNETAQTEVIYNQASSFEVIVPKLVDLGADKMTNYEVTILGDISSDEVIKVVPEESFLMKDKSGTSNLKADVEATVTQDKTEWIFNEFETKANGNISAPNLTAGSWEGSFFFNIKLDKASAEEIEYVDFVLTKDNYEMAGIKLDDNITIPETFEYDGNYYRITEIGEAAFDNNDILTSITIPSSVKKIGDVSFAACNSLENVIISEGVLEIGKMAFSNCHSLTSITIPSSIVVIGDNIFGRVSSLTSITWNGKTYTDKTEFNNAIINAGIATKAVWN
jgi:hypothetical protein